MNKTVKIIIILLTVGSIFGADIAYSAPYLPYKHIPYSVRNKMHVSAKASSINKRASLASNSEIGARGDIRRDRRFDRRYYRKSPRRGEVYDRVYEKRHMLRSRYDVRDGFSFSLSKLLSNLKIIN